MRGGEEVELYLGGEDFLGEGSLEEGGEALLEDSEGWDDGQYVCEIVRAYWSW